MASAYDMSRFDDRHQPRSATRLPGALLTYRHRDEILLENVSRSGALVSGEGMPDRGTEVVLDAGALHVVATVVWAGDHLCGLRFHRAVEPAVLRTLRDA